jgi:hypothetical protein
MAIELRQNNLYSNAKIYSLTDNEELLLREIIPFKGTVTDTYHTVMQGDRLDLIAWKYYRNQVEDASKYWWLIADANNIIHPLDLSDYVGKELLIPNISKAQLQI